MKSDANTRHRKFKNELRKYHDTINRGNRYSLPKISGKLNVFEAEDGSEGSENNEDEKKSKIETDRMIPNTGLSVLYDGTFYAIGDRDSNPITDFKYSFIEGALGDKKKIISCVTDDGKIEYFDVENETIVECMEGGAVGGGISTSTLNSGGTGEDGSSNRDDDYHEIDYSKVKKDLTIPFLSGYRIKDMRSGKLLHKGIKKNKRSKKRKS